jgi:hypothetical protein
MRQDKGLPVHLRLQRISSIRGELRSVRANNPLDDPALANAPSRKTNQSALQRLRAWRACPRAPLGDDRCEVLLPCLQRSCRYVRRTFEIHREPNRPYEQTIRASAPVLRKPPPVFLGKLCDLEIMSLDFLLQLGTAGGTVLRLDSRYRFQVVNLNGWRGLLVSDWGSACAQCDS